jgi:hypothetical protein
MTTTIQTAENTGLCTKTKLFTQNVFKTDTQWNKDIITDKKVKHNN